MAINKSLAGLPYNHTPTGIKIYKSIICNTCPYRIYADQEETVKFGIGNIFGDFIFIVNSYNTKSKIGEETTLTRLSDMYKYITGMDMFENVYVTRLVKCFKNVEHNLYSTAVTPCSHYLMYEVNRLSAKHVVFFGSTYEDYIANSDVVGYNIPIKTIHKCYSPDVLFYDNIKIKERFIKTLSAILLNN